MKPILIRASIGVAGLWVSSGFAQDAPTQQNVPEPVAQGDQQASNDGEQVKRFIVSAKFDKVIGTFDLFGPPREGAEFEIDLAKMPLEKLGYSFNRTDTTSNGHLSFRPALKVAKVETNKFTTTIFLASEDGGEKTKVQITGNTPLANGSRVYLYVYRESGERISGMAGASGTLKEHQTP